MTYVEKHLRPGAIVAMAGRLVPAEDYAKAHGLKMASTSIPAAAPAPAPKPLDGRALSMAVMRKILAEEGGVPGQADVSKPAAAGSKPGRASMLAELARQGLEPLR